MKINELDHELLSNDILEKEISTRMLQELDENNVYRVKKFDEALPDMVGELLDNDVTILNFLGQGRRIVFAGEFQGKKIVVKFSHSHHDRDHDERQQQQEELIWDTAMRNGEEKYFARIFISSMQSNYVVQEFCTKQDSDYIFDLLPPEHYRIAEKYNIHELLMGKNEKGDLVFVDYGM